MNFDGHTVITPQSARARGFSPLTLPISIVLEDQILRNVIADMRRGGTRFVLVGVSCGIEVWRAVPGCGGGK